MSATKNRKYKPYIRKLQPQDRTESLRVAVRMSYYEVMKKPAYVLVQHGFPHNVLEIDDTKASLKNRIVGIHCKRMTFREYQITTKNYAAKGVL